MRNVALDLVHHLPFRKGLNVCDWATLSIMNDLAVIVVLIPAINFNSLRLAVLMTKHKRNKKLKKRRIIVKFFSKKPSTHPFCF